MPCAPRYSGATALGSSDFQQAASALPPPTAEEVAAAKAEREAAEAAESGRRLADLTSRGATAFGSQDVYEDAKGPGLASLMAGAALAGGDRLGGMFGSLKDRAAAAAADNWPRKDGL